MHIPVRAGAVASAVLLALILSKSAPAQEDAAVPAPTAAAETAQDPEIDPGDLKSRLRPLRKAELETELEAWLGVLETKAQEIAAAEIARRAADAAGNSQQVDTLSEQLVALRAQRDEIKDRAGIVIGMAAERGVDVTEAELYVGSIGGMVQLEASGIQSTIAEIKAWLLSKDGGLRLLIAIAQFLGVLIAFRILAGVLAGLLDRAVRRLRKTSDLLRDFVVNTTRKVVFFVGIVIALSYIGVNIGPLIAAIGAAGFVIGFALQGTLSNFAAGLMILIYRPYDLGDVITAAGVTGKVDAMTLVSTAVKTPDNQTIVIPNGSIWGNVITNITANTTRRVDLTFGVSYSDDLDKVKAVLLDVIRAHPMVLADPEPVVEVNELADSSVNFVARPWAATSDYWTVYWDLHKQVKQRFDQEGISIPFPQRDVHLLQPASS